VPAAARRLRLRSGGGRPLFYELSEVGFDAASPSTELSEGLEISRELLDGKGEPVTTVELGDTVQVRLRLRTADGVSTPGDVAIVDLLPGGLEHVMRRPADDEDADNPLTRLGGVRRGDWEPDWAQLAEDRLVLYGSAWPNVSEFRYTLRATTRGHFVLPAPYASAMYDPRATAHGRAGVLEVR
jgi:uncharacterized protein YfaS (alpha-2-macroglobulin family)